jgi:hypothetical protein
MNAAVWFGATLFYLVAARPLFFSERFLSLIPQPHAGAGLHLLMENFYRLYSWCAAVALGHLVVECLYAGKAVRKWVVSLLVILFCYGLIGAFWIQPRLQALHLQRHGIYSLAEQQEQARRSYRMLSGFNQFLQVVTTCGLVIYVWQLTSPGIVPRFAATTKFRG